MVASNPEFLREGSAIYDSLFPDRIVVGADSREALYALRMLYEPVIEQSFPTELDPRPKVAVPFVTTDLASAEMIKYAANSFLATKISFINEVASLCELVGADVSEVAYGIGLDGRIGSRFLSAGIGWGGSCLNVPAELEEVYHFASPASPKDFERIPIPILKVGALGTYNALGLALARGARFMLASSSEVYGDPLVHPQTEDYRGNVNPIGVRGVYDEAKRYAESITFAYHRHHKVHTRIVRIFNTYGPRMRQDDGRMVPTFVSQALAGQPLTIYGDGSQTRSIQYVDDLIEGTWRLMNSSEVRPVNVGNPQEMRVREIAELVIELTGSGSDIVYEPLPEDDPRRRCPDVARAREALGWEPRVPIRKGLKKTIDWFVGRSSRHEASPARR